MSTHARALSGIFAALILALPLALQAPAHADPLDDVGNAVDDAADDVGDTVDGAGDAVDDAADDTGDAVDDTADDVGDAVDDATGGAGGIGDAVDDVGDTVDDTADDLGDTVDDTADDVGDAVDDGGDAIDETDPGGIGGVLDEVDDGSGSGGGSGSLPGAPAPGLPTVPSLPGSPGEPGVIDPIQATIGGDIRGSGEASGSAATGPDPELAAALAAPIDGFAGSIGAASPAASEPPADGGFLQGVGRAALEAAKKLAFPAALTAVIVTFLLIYSRYGRKDPKLALAPVDSDQEYVTFD